MENEIVPIETHPEQYESNLFGEKVAENFFEKTSDVAHGKHGQTVSQKFSSTFNIFSLTDAIGARNKREAWMLYQKALASGMVAEEIFYKVFWQIKTLLLASRTKTAEEAEMKSYPYNKAKGYLKNYKPGELEKISEDLVKSYHQVRRGEEETETLVEKTLLRL